jgi:ribosomal protein S18 acetylase RimI-like enzyme
MEWKDGLVAQSELGERRGAGGGPLRLAAVAATDLPLLEQLVRAYYLEDGHIFHEGRQPAALAALVAGEPFGPAWLIEVERRAVGYLVLSWGFSVEAGGREVCLDEIYLVPEMRNRGLGRRVLALVEAEARAIGGRRIFLEVERHNRAIGLYCRAGYLEHDRFLMSKLLDR